MNSATNIYSLHYANQQHIALDVQCKGQYTLPVEEKYTEETSL